MIRPNWHGSTARLNQSVGTAGLLRVGLGGRLAGSGPLVRSCWILVHLCQCTWTEVLPIESRKKSVGGATAPGLPEYLYLLESEAPSR